MYCNCKMNISATELYPKHTQVTNNTSVKIYKQHTTRLTKPEAINQDFYD